VGKQFRHKWRDVDGILLLDKPAGLSSNQALQTVRRIYNARKAGHTGSLDPFATGLLPVCFGQATKISGQMLEAAKTYRVTCQLGVQTGTGDPEGEVIAEAPVPQLQPVDIARTLEKFSGDIEQVPPMYSALKHQGERLYKLARQGIEVKRKPRKVHIFSLELESAEAETMKLKVHCSKGTYIRTLVQDLARDWGTVAHASALRRVAVEPFVDISMTRIDELEALRDEPSALQDLLLTPDRALLSLPACQLEAEASKRLRMGQAVVAPEADKGRVRVYGPDELFLGIGEVDETGTLHPKRLMVGNQEIPVEGL
jgi:tRNA pseudouridine55 synthase